MTTATLNKYPLISEVWPAEDRAEKTGTCPWLMATCSTCMYCREPDDAWETGDYNSRCVYATKADLEVGLMTKERQDALDHFNRFFDLVELYEAQAANAIKDEPKAFELIELAARHEIEIGHELLQALPTTGLALPLMVRVSYRLYKSYATTMRQTIAEAMQRVKEEESDAREN